MTDSLRVTHRQGAVTLRFDGDDGVEVLLELRPSLALALGDALRRGAAAAWDASEHIVPEVACETEQL